MALSRVKNWIAGEILYATDLNAEFNNILNNGEDLITPATKAHDMNGFELVMDADADLGIIADTDDRFDIKLGSTRLFRFDATTATSVNGFDFFSSATTTAVRIAAQGSDSNIALNLVPKGSGQLQWNAFALGEQADVTLAGQVFSL